MDITHIEEWRPITVAEFSNSYEVSNLGRIRGIARFRRNRSNVISPVRPRIMKLRKGNRGYVTIFLRVGTPQKIARCFPVHRLVAMAFIPNPLGLPEVNHLDLDKANNRAENLEWISRLNNYLHAAAAGVARFKRTLTDEDVTTIREMCLSGLAQAEIARRYGVNQSTVSRIAGGKRRG